jgi:hypothetical protein
LLLQGFFVVVLFSSSLPAQPADVDALSHDLDLSILDPAEKTEAHSLPSQAPADHLFVQFDRLPEIAAPRDDQWVLVEDSPLVKVNLPARSYLVVPNPARMDQAYSQMATALEDKLLKPVFPLKIVLHADGNFSLAIALETPPSHALPQGVDLSPVQEMVFVGVEADIQVLRRNHPPVLQAYVLLQSAAKKAGLELETSELYFFPLSPGKVLLALPVR